MKLALLIAALALLAAGAAWVVSRSRSESRGVRRALTRAPTHGWRSDRVTPAGLGPRNSAPERVTRGAVLTQAVLLAVEMARVDGEIAEQEKQAIRDFVLHQVPEADEALAAKVLREGLDQQPSSATIASAIETIRAIASEEQRRLIIQLFVHVAQADGRIDPEELRFMQQIGVGLGLTAEAIDELIPRAAS